MRTLGCGLLTVALLAPAAAAQSVPLDFRFTYQGELRLANVVVDQPADFQFSLFDQPAGGNQIGSTNDLNAVPVTRGVFEVELDFGNTAFAGDRRHLEIAVRTPAGSGTFTTLTPRVELTPTPNAHYSRFSGLAFNAFELDGLDSTDFVQQGEASSITSAMIVPGNVTNSDLQNGSVSTAKIQTGAVTNNEIAFATITGAKVADGSIGAADLAVDAVDSSKILDGSITAADLATGSVDSSKIVDGSVTSADLAAGATDGGDADTVDGLNSSQFLRSDVNDALNSTQLQINAGFPNDFTIAGANLNLFLGDSAADSTVARGPLTAESTLTVEGNTALGDASTDTTSITGDVTVTDGDLSFNGLIQPVLSASSGLIDVGGNTSLRILDGANLHVFDEAIIHEGIILGDGAAISAEGPGFAWTLGGDISIDGTQPLKYTGDGSLFFTDMIWGTSPTGTMTHDGLIDRFRVTDGLDVTGPVSLGTQSPSPNPLSYHRVGSATTSNGDITNTSDLLISSDLQVGQDVYLGLGEGDSSLYFYDNGSTTGSFIAWDNNITSVSCSNAGSVSSGFVSNIDDNTDSAWVLQNGSDNELVMHAGGDMEIDGSYWALGSCDVAETFFGDADLEPGTVVTLDPRQAEGVRESRRAYDPTLVGVVSTRPGLLLSGPSSDAYPMYEEMSRARADAAANPDDAELVRRVDDLERALDSWARGEVPVALAGRVPVKVVGPVEFGEPLTSSDVPGHAMAMDTPGVSIGIAMESKASAGAGTILVLVGRGWGAPTGADAEPEREAVALGRAGDDRFAALEQRLAQVEQRVVRGDDGRTGRDGRDGRSSIGRDGADGEDGRGGRTAGPVVRIEKEAWGDVDGDGLDDVAVLDGAGLTLYRNLGSGAFQDVTEPAGLGDVDGVRIALLEDVDLDRSVDLLIVDADGAARLLQGSGAFTFTDVTAAFGLDFGQPIVEARFLDHDRDGRPDLRVELADGTLLLHHNLGAGTFRTTTLRPALDGGDASAADARIAELEAQVEALTEMVEALAGAKGGR